jgi:phosphate:Na+ symporter
MLGWHSLLQLLGALGLFLFSMEFLSRNLQEINLDTLKAWLLRSTKTPFHGLATGTVVTSLLGSSSVVIVILIAFVDSRLISFTNSLGLVLGANVGTTISSQIIAFKVGDYASITLFLGVLGALLAKDKKNKVRFNLLSGISLIFFSLHLMDQSMASYKDSPQILDWMSQLNDPLSGIIVGGGVTLLIQSSSATVAMAITLGSQGIISLDAGIAVMLGSEIGTCSDTLLATIGRTREAVRIGLFHLLYNIFAVIMGFWTIGFLKNFVILISAGADTARMIANAHFIFNTGGALVFLLLIPVMQKILLFLIPEAQRELKPTSAQSL